MKLIVGLGNPGKRYIKTRHNVGFMVLNFLFDELTKEAEISNWELSKKFNAEICGTNINSDKIILAKPMTFMNASGHSVALLANYYKIPPRDIIVVHDDKDLPLGEIKVQKDRSSAGHNGVKSIIEAVGTQDFTRVRIGISPTNEKRKQDTAKFVLGKFSVFEKNKLNKAVEGAAMEIRKLI